MEAATATMVVDLNTLSRRELQALCKLNGVRANMTNLAMAEALQSLPSVDGIDQIGTTLCLPTPGKSAMKSALRAADQQQQQQGSPLPRGRRVSVKSPEALRMDAEDEEVDQTKRDLFREIVRTPGVALRSASRRPPATPAPPVPTPAAGTLRRSLRSAARKSAAPVGDVGEVSTAKRPARKTVGPMAMIYLDQEEEDMVQQVEPEGVTSDERCDDPVVEEVTKLPEEGNSKGDEPEQGEEGAVIGEEQKLVNAEESPILGVLSKAAPEPAMKNIENALTEDREVFGNWSPVLEIADDIKCASEDKEVVAVEVPGEAVKEDACNSTIEAAAAPNNMVSAAVTVKEVPVDELLPADLNDDQSAEKYDLVAESGEVDGLDDDEEDMLKADRTVNEKSDETIEAPVDVNFDSEEEEEHLKMPETGEETKEVVASDSLAEEEDDFSADLPSEFDDVLDFSDAETASESSPVAMEGINAAASSAASKEGVVSQHVEIIVKSLDEITITEEKKEECAKGKKQLKVGKEMSLRKLKSAYKESLIAAKKEKELTITSEEGSRVVLAELDDNAEC